MLERIGVVDDIEAAGVRATAMRDARGRRRSGPHRRSMTSTARSRSRSTTAQTETERVLAERLPVLGGRSSAA